MNWLVTLCLINTMQRQVILTENFQLHHITCTPSIVGCDFVLSTIRNAHTVNHKSWIMRNCLPRMRLLNPCDVWGWVTSDIAWENGSFIFYDPLYLWALNGRLHCHYNVKKSQFNWLSLYLIIIINTILTLKTAEENNHLTMQLCTYVYIYWYVVFSFKDVNLTIKFLIKCN